MIAVRLLGFLLVAEGVTTLFWLVRLAPSLGWRDPASTTLILFRGLVGAMQLTSGWWLSTRRPSAGPLARLALFLSAALMTLEIGERMSPTNLDPTYRWPLVIAYWVYALGAGWFLSRAARRLEPAAFATPGPPPLGLADPAPPAVVDPPAADDPVRPGESAGE